MTVARVSWETAEVLNTPDVPALRVTKEAVDVIASTLPPPLRVSKISVDLLVSNTLPATPRRPIYVIESAHQNSAWLNVDPYFANVVNLLHFDGADGSTGIVDETGASWSAAGNAQIDNGQSMFGGSSLYLDGNGDYVSRGYDPAAHDWWTTDHTIEFWCRLTGNPSGSLLPTGIGNGVPASSTLYWALGFLADRRLSFYYWKGSTTYIEGVTAVGLNGWHHLAMTHEQGVINLFLDGQLEASFPVAGTPLSSAIGGSVLSIGRCGNVQANMHIDDLRITKGVARYSGNFTPPPAPFPNS